MASDELAPELAALLEEMQPLSFPVPPMLEVALAYRGTRRFVAFFWAREGNGVMFDDGRLSGFGYSPAWHRYIKHPRVVPYRAGLNFGGNHATANCYLVLDRTKRRAYSGDMMTTLRLLFQQPDVSFETDSQSNAGTKAQENAQTNAGAPALQTDSSLAREQVQQATHALGQWLDAGAE